MRQSENPLINQWVRKFFERTGDAIERLACAVSDASSVARLIELSDLSIETFCLFSLDFCPIFDRRHTRKEVPKLPVHDQAWSRKTRPGGKTVNDIVRGCL